MFELLSESAVQQGLNQAILLAGLVAARMMPVVQLVPYMGGKAVPAQVKMGLALALTVLVYPAVWSSGAAAQLPEGPLEVAGLLIKELGVGVMIGFIAGLVFQAARMAGQIIDLSRGQTKATSMVPQLKTQASVSANFLVQLFIAMFLITGGHHLFLRVLTRSFLLIPPQDFLHLGGNGAALVFGIARLATDTITLSVLLAFPVIAAILLTNFFLALVNKAAPQINVFFLGMPLKALVGIIVILLALDPLLQRFMDEAALYLGQTLRYIEILSP